MKTRNSNVGDGAGEGLETTQQLPDIWWVPVQVSELLMKEKVTFRQANLLVIINRLAIGGIKKGIGGCYAQNRTLARMAGLTIHQVGLLINKWTRRGILIKVGRAPSKSHGGIGANILVTSWTQLGPRNDRSMISTGRSLSTDSIDCIKEIHNGGLPTPGERKQMGFLSGNTPAKEISAAPIDQKRAEKLRSGLVEQSPRLAGRWSKKKWADEFRLLRQEVKDEKLIDRVLDWYLVCFGGEYVPQAYSARAFRQKFNQIVAARKRDANAVVMDVEVTSEAQDLVKFYQHLGWPKGSKDLLPAATQLSLDSYRKFWRAVKRVEKLGGKYAGHATRLLSHFAGGYVTSWFRLVHERYGSWGAWSGDLRSMIFAPDHKLFVEVARGWMREYSGKANDYDKLLEATNG